ncbi:hypothetical protein BT93_F1122 [Corymbia citriodora subsp. variegata]|nr:hypothetical protein BT93_F1122 [Corymbia citriodora subsp. variegata]
MVRPFGIKRSNKKRKEKYDAEIEEGEHEQEPQPKQLKADDVSREEEAENQEKQLEEEEDDAVHQLEGIPLAPVQSQGSKNVGITFVLEKATLEVAKVGKTYQILNSDDHANFLKRNGRNPAEYRPDIVHQALLSILDSPLNKAGKVRAVYVRTEKGVLFEVKPHVRIPRTYKRFSGIMLQLLQKLSITAAGKREKLLRSNSPQKCPHLHSSWPSSHTPGKIQEWSCSTWSDSYHCSNER